MFKRWKAKRAKVEQCETCRRWLRRSEVVEVTDAGYGSTEFGPGGYSITATFCRTHAPLTGARP